VQRMSAFFGLAPSVSSSKIHIFGNYTWIFTDTELFLGVSPHWDTLAVKDFRNISIISTTCATFTFLQEFKNVTESAFLISLWAQADLTIELPGQLYDLKINISTTDVANLTLNLNSTNVTFHGSINISGNLTIGIFGTEISILKISEVLDFSHNFELILKGSSTNFELDVEELHFSESSSFACTFPLDNSGFPRVMIGACFRCPQRLAIAITTNNLQFNRTYSTLTHSPFHLFKFPSSATPLSCTLSWKCKCDLPKSFGIRNF
jgi:hypothetical protein